MFKKHEGCFVNPLSNEKLIKGYHMCECIRNRRKQKKPLFREIIYQTISSFEHRPLNLVGVNHKARYLIDSNQRQPDSVLCKLTHLEKLKIDPSKRYSLIFDTAIQKIQKKSKKTQKIKIVQRTKKLNDSEFDHTDKFLEVKKYMDLRLTVPPLKESLIDERRIRLKNRDERFKPSLGF